SVAEETRVGAKHVSARLVHDAGAARGEHYAGGRVREAESRTRQQRERARGGDSQVRRTRVKGGDLHIESALVIGDVRPDQIARADRAKRADRVVRACGVDRKSVV